MKIKYAIAASLLLSISAYAQKDELKALKKLTEKQQPAPADLDEMEKNLSAVESKMSAATPEQQVDYNYYKGMYGVYKLMSSPTKSQTLFEDTLASFNKVIEQEKNGKKKYTQQIEQNIYPNLKANAINGAQELGRAKMFKEAAIFYAAAYRVDPKDANNLYNAAAMAVNAQDYDRALEYYIELDKSGFTGEGTSYTAKNKATGEFEAFPNKTTRDLSVKQGVYSDPKDEKSPSLKGEIVKNIALIYVQKGETEKAKQAMSNARKANPDDVSLIIAEADLYLKTGDKETYKKLIGEALAKNPKDVDLLYNLGVVTSATDPAEGAKYYEKALELDPNYLNALINLGVLQLNGEQKIVEQMNSLGTSAKDNQRYEVLKKQRNDLYAKSLPYLEKAHKIAPDNQEVIGMLAGVYQALERDADYKAMKAKIKK